MIKGNPEYISLREAAKMSGYSSDYLGQLIRQGKIPGKQVFTNVSWVTTKEAMQDYMSKTEKKSETTPVRASDWIASFEGIAAIYRWTLIGITAVTIVILVFLFFVAAISIDHSIERVSSSLFYVA